MDKYKWGESFQIKILTLMVQDPTFLATHSDAINPAYFEKAPHQAVCTLLMYFFSTYQAIPDGVSASALAEDYLTKYPVGEAVASEIRGTLAYIYSVQLGDYAYVKDRVLQFGQRQSLKEAVGEVLDLLDGDGEYNKARSIVDKALQVGQPKSMGMDLGTTLADLPRLLASSPIHSRRIPTLIPKLDRCMAGGLGIGEFGVVIGAKNSGKSTVLANFGYGAAMAGFRVCHLCFELKELDIVLKYAARHTGMDMAEITTSPGYLQHISRAAVPEDRVKIKYFSPGSCNTGNLRALLSFMHTRGFQPDLLILDYIKGLKYDSGNTYASLGQLSQELITLGDDFKCGVWTAQQTKRGFHFAQQAELAGIAEAWSLVENADAALALSQNMQEHKANRLRIEVGGMRRGEDTWTIPCHIKYGKATLKEITPEEEQAEQARAGALPQEVGK